MSASNLNYPPPLYLTSPSDQRFVEWLRRFSAGVNDYKSIINGAYTSSAYLPGNVSPAAPAWMEILKMQVDQVVGHAVEVYVNASGFDASSGTPILWMEMEGTDGDNDIKDTMGQAFVKPATGNKIDDSRKVAGLASCRCIFAGQLYTSGACPQLNLGSGDFTIEFWIYPPGGSLGSYVLEHFWYPGYTISFGVSTSRQAFIYGGINLASIDDDDRVPYDEWSHVAFVRKGTTVTIYVNGNSVASTSSSYSIDNGVNTVFYACSHNSNYIAAHEIFIDELKIWNVARYEADFTPSAATGGVFDIRLLKDGTVVQQKLSASLTSDLNMTHLVDLRLSEDGVHEYAVELRSVTPGLKIGEVSMIARFV